MLAAALSGQAALPASISALCWTGGSDRDWAARKVIPSPAAVKGNSRSRATDVSSTAFMLAGHRLDRRAGEVDERRWRQKLPIAHQPLTNYTYAEQAPPNEAVP